MEDNKKVNQNTVMPQRWHTAQKLLSIGLHNSLLKDEIYCQICKQLTQHSPTETTTREKYVRAILILPNSTFVSDAYRRGWELLSFVIHTFAPSKDLEFYMYAKLCTLIDTEKLGVDVWSVPQFCIDSLCKTVTKTSRKFVPTFHELEVIKVICCWKCYKLIYFSCKLLKQ
jgi:hypothetical protein